MDTKSRPQGANSYKRNLFITDTGGDQVNPESRSGESTQGESRLVWLMRRFAKGVQRKITDFLKASLTTDSIKIFSITLCTLVTVYCTCKIAKDAFS